MLHAILSTFQSDQRMFELEIAEICSNRVSGVKRPESWAASDPAFDSDWDAV